MKYWIISDTHFGHYKMMDYCKRPKNFEDKILENLYKNINEYDCLIHLGDICIGEDDKWNAELLDLLPYNVKYILIKGNHDSKSDVWYYDRGWDFVCETFTLNKYGYNILFSHIPQHDTGFDINIHGHLHNVNRRKEINIKLDKHILYAPEYENYKPITLKHIIERIK